MATEHISDEKKAVVPKPEHRETEQTRTEAPLNKAPLESLQQTIGNRAVQRLLAQRRGEAPAELDDETANRVNSARGGGQPLDDSVRTGMESAFGTDFSGVRVHDSSEDSNLSRDLGAKAFTVGQDIFFNEGEYQPQSSGGQQLLAHEMTHVVQQSSGAVSGGSRMTVGAPGDAFEKEADSIASQVTSGGVAQMAGVPEEEDPLQAQPMEDEDKLQMLEIPEEEEEVALQGKEEEEEEIPLQKQEEDEDKLQMVQIPEEEEAALQGKEEDEDKLQMQQEEEEEIPVQKQEEDELEVG
ncbi:MAG: DUF4157 domain-containing protein [Chloroflexota bacterium]|nr:MAG: DUF4157 domain-containing protein [Chloroflexota bacterium]